MKNLEMKVVFGGISLTGMSAMAAGLGALNQRFYGTDLRATECAILLLFIPVLYCALNYLEEHRLEYAAAFQKAYAWTVAFAKKAAADAKADLRARRDAAVYAVRHFNFKAAAISCGKGLIVAGKQIVVWGCTAAAATAAFIRWLVKAVIALDIPSKTKTAAAFVAKHANAAVDQLIAWNIPEKLENGYEACKAGLIKIRNMTAEKYAAYAEANEVRGNEMAVKANAKAAEVGENLKAAGSRTLATVKTATTGATEHLVALKNTLPGRAKATFTAIKAKVTNPENYRITIGEVKR